MTFPVVLNIIGALVNAGFYLYSNNVINLICAYISLVFALYFYFSGLVVV